MIRKIEETLIKEQYKEAFLQKDGSQSLQSWLIPFEDGSLPNCKIVMTILKCIDELPV